MNAAALLAHYERIADAPDSVGRLRRFVLDLAVRGKLVPRCPSDGFATDLLGQIDAKKSLLIKAGEIKKERDLSNVDEATPFTLPYQWAWTRLGVITSYIQRGKSPKYSASDGSRVVSQKCVQWSGLDLSACRLITFESLDEYEPHRFLRDGDLLWNSTGTGTIGRVARVTAPPAKLVCDSHVTVVRCLLAVPEYVRIWLRTDDVYGTIEGRAAGSTNQVELTSQMAISQLVPLPPLAEQHRIVAKVDELMALCDRLEAARAEREVTRDRLAAASLARLNTPDPDPEAFQAHASFAISTAVPALTTRPDQIKQLRQTIINLAVRGKLVMQDPDDEPASKMIRRIKSSKLAAYDAEGLRVRAPVQYPTRHDLKFDFPLSWDLAAFDELFVIISGVTLGQKIPANESIDVPYLRVANVQRGYLALDVIKTVPVRESDLQRFSLRAGDILMTEGGDWDKLGRAAIWQCEVPDCIHQNHVFRVRSPSAEILPEWVTTYVNSVLGRAFFEDASKQTTNLASINMTQLRSCPIPVPPTAEQDRIVAKVKELMQLCDQLEASLESGSVARRRLLDALLHEALAPAKEFEEAA